MQNYKKILVKFEELSLEVWASPEHEWLMETALVAKGYEIGEKAIHNHKSRNSEEFIEGKHFIVENDKNPISSELVETHKMWVSTNLQIKRIFWTKRGVIRLGFFIKSKKAKLFRDWAEDLIINYLEKNEVMPEWFKPFQQKMEQELEDLKWQINRLEKRTAILPENLEAFVYIILNPDSGGYKIGHSKDVNTRITKGRTFLPNLQVVMNIPCPDPRYAMALENFLHTHFYYKRIDLEWYRLDADDLIQIHEIIRILSLS
ncbi:MAG: GIY-YIG nuclease family protein [Microscillaceae bacterium]|jgi:hypothetical protein|nr:GIY-YIG nuclease family protein [Microscillaceae bacterium]